MSHRTTRALRLAALTLAAALPLAGCATDTHAELAGWETYGALISAAEPMSLDTLLADAEAYNGQTVVLEAPIAECCANKGCWMTLVQGDQSVRVKFLDYGFFVPLDSAGRTVRLEGVFSIRDVPVEEARHYLEDAGRMEEAAAISEPQRSFEIVASGVLLSSET